MNQLEIERYLRETMLRYKYYIRLVKQPTDRDHFYYGVSKPMGAKPIYIITMPRLDPKLGRRLIKKLINFRIKTAIDYLEGFT